MKDPDYIRFTAPQEIRRIDKELNNPFLSKKDKKKKMKQIDELRALLRPRCPLQSSSSLGRIYATIANAE